MLKIQPRDQIFVKGYGFFSFAKNMGRKIGKKICKNLSNKFRQKFLDRAKQSATDGLKTTSKRAIQKTAEGTSDLIDNKIADKITKVSKTSPQNKSDTVTNEHDKDIPKERHIYLQKKQRKLFTI